MPSYPQRAGYQNYIIKSTLPSRQSSRDIHAIITAVIFLKGRQVAMSPCFSSQQRDLAWRRQISSSPLVCEHWTPCRDLKRTLQGGAAESECRPAHGAIILISLGHGRPPTVFILYDRINLRKNSSSDNYSYGFSLQA